MKMRDTIKRAGRSLRQAKARTLLTSLAIGVGAFTIVLSLAAGEGGRQYASDIVSANTNVRELNVQMKFDEGGDPTAPKEYSDDPTVDYGGGFSMKLLSQKDIDKIAALNDVESVTPYYNVTAKYITRSEGGKKFTTGVETYNPSIKLDYAAGGDANITKNSAIIPDKLVEALGFTSNQSAIGEKVSIAVEIPDPQTFQPVKKEYQYTIIGVSQSSAISVTGNNVVRLQKDATAELYAAINGGQTENQSYIAASVLIKEGADPAEVKERIIAAGDYDAQTAEDAMSFLFQFINVLQGILIGFGALAVLTAVFGIINTQYISVLERTQQIGLMKALGMKRKEVGRLFKIEAAWIGFIGGALGAGGAVLAGIAANPWISETLKLDDTKLLIFSPISIVIVVVGLMIISVVAGILPARKASKLDPIVALRTE